MKKVREENGSSPKNARIKIDYSKNKPKVNFSYPSKNTQFEGSMFPYISLFWLGIFILIMGSLIIFKPPLQEEGKNASDYNFSNYSDYLRFLEEKNIIYLSWENSQKEESLFETLWISLWYGEEGLPGVLPFFLSLLVMSGLTYFPFKNYWKRVYPRVQGGLARKKIAKFTKKDVLEENKLYYCELPVFSNIVLDYKATEDFSKYLNLFEIREHKFKYYFGRVKKLRQRLRKTKNLRKREKIKKRIKKKVINEWLWYARFYFNELPKKGNIEVLFK